LNAVDDDGYLDEDYLALFDEDEIPGGTNSINHDVQYVSDSLFECYFNMVKGKKLVIPLLCGNKRINALIDTGASITLVRPEFRGNCSRSASCAVRYGNGHTEKLREKTFLRMMIDGVSYNHWAWLANDLPYDVVLGTDFLSGRASIDLVDYVIKFKQASEDILEFSVDTPATDHKIYQEYALKKRNKDTEYIENRISDPKLKHLILGYIQKFWECNKDEWLPCRFPAYRITTTSEEAPWISARSSQKEAEFTDGKVDEWIMKSCTRPSISRYGAPTLLVPKKQYEGISSLLPWKIP
jgi:hypothetical protein